MDAKGPVSAFKVKYKVVPLFPKICQRIQKCIYWEVMGILLYQGFLRLASLWMFSWQNWSWDPEHFNFPKM